MATVVLDTPPRSETAALEAARAADLVVVPCRPQIVASALGLTVGEYEPAAVCCRARGSDGYDHLVIPITSRGSLTLFEPFADQARFKDRDVVARAVADLYRGQQQEFPPECRDADYEQRITAAYPIHPEVIDRLYTDWSTLVTFQRTRGVLRLMAAVVHSLWEKGDRSPLILPANLSIDDFRGCSSS